jgi:hypothetical protein
MRVFQGKLHAAVTLTLDNREVCGCLHSLVALFQGEQLGAHAREAGWVAGSVWIWSL